MSRDMTVNLLILHGISKNNKGVKIVKRTMMSGIVKRLENLKKQLTLPYQSRSIGNFSAIKFKQDLLETSKNGIHYPKFLTNHTSIIHNQSQTVIGNFTSSNKPVQNHDLIIVNNRFCYDGTLFPQFFAFKYAKRVLNDHIYVTNYKIQPYVDDLEPLLFSIFINMKTKEVYCIFYSKTKVFPQLSLVTTITKIQQKHNQLQTKNPKYPYSKIIDTTATVIEPRKLIDTTPRKSIDTTAKSIKKPKLKTPINDEE